MVYDRPKSPFTWRDILRIVDRKEPPGSLDPDWNHFLLVVQEMIEKYAQVAENGSPELENVFLGIPEQFSGGDFGGAGASGTVDLPRATRLPGESVFAIGPCGERWIAMPIQPC